VPCTVPGETTGLRMTMALKLRHKIIRFTGLATIFAIVGFHLLIFPHSSEPNPATGQVIRHYGRGGSIYITKDEQEFDLFEIAGVAIIGFIMIVFGGYIKREK
jgi:hypothetical protein